MIVFNVRLYRAKLYKCMNVYRMRFLHIVRDYAVIVHIALEAKCRVGQIYLHTSCCCIVVLAYCKGI